MIIQQLSAWVVVLLLLSFKNEIVSGRTPDESSITLAPVTQEPIPPPVVETAATTTNTSSNLEITNDNSNNSNSGGNSTQQLRPQQTQCFNRPFDSCPASGEKCHCKRLTDPSKVICCDVVNFLLLEGLHCAGVGVTDEVTELHIRNATLDELNVTLANFRRLKSMSVTDGRIGHVVGEFAKHTPIACLNLSNNALHSIEERALVHLYNLSTLDFSHNNLTGVPNFKRGTVISLDISGNNEMLCQSLFKAKNKSELHFVNANKTYCSFSKTFHWFNTTELLPLVQVESVYTAQKACWGNCTCEPYRLDIVPGKPPTFAFMVDCSGKQLTEMPAQVPPSTIALNISNNNITTLNIAHESFQNIRELYADNNQITSILLLEGTKFMDNFVALSLRNNKLKTLPSYMLSNIFDRNPNSRQVHLGLNRLQCDCNTAKTLKVWLLTKQKNILDYDEILCENYPLKVLQLDPAQLCQNHNQDWKDYIYYIITAEVLLLVGLVLKVSYDYWVFKTAGYLPWPASKMPKLPCDWLCE